MARSADIQEFTVILNRLKKIIRANFQDFSPDHSEPVDSFTNTQHTAGHSYLKFSALELEYYANLELEPGADFSRIKKNYRLLMSRYHPDRYQNDESKRIIAEKITVKLNEAWVWFKKKHSEQT